MTLQTVAARHVELGLIAIMRGDSETTALRLADALMEGGIKAIEVTFTVPGAHRVLESLVRVSEGEDVLIGAGTVLDAETARISVLAGARFIVSPVLALDVVHVANRYNALPIPGTSTPTEIFQARNAGVQFVKVFPASVLGPGFIKSVKPLFPGVSYVPTGGVTIHNARDWIAAGAAVVGIGGDLTSPGRMGDYAEVTRRARAFVNVLREVGQS